MPCDTRNALSAQPFHANASSAPLTTLNSIGNGTSGAIERSAATVSGSRAGPIMVSGSVRPECPIESSSPGRPPMWSACRCVIAIVSMAFMPHPFSRMAICVPSPQSMSRLLPL